MKLLRWVLLLLFLNGVMPLLFSSVQKKECPMLRDYYLYLPEKIDPNRTYWLVCYVHGSNGSGRSDIPSLQHFVERGDCIGVAPSFAPGFQLLENGTDAQLIGILRQLSEKYKIHAKLFVYGHSAGGQFSHRFALRYPGLVIGCEACSSGTWATGGVYQNLTPDAKMVPMAIGCGGDDVEQRGATIARLANNHAEAENLVQNNHSWNQGRGLHYKMHLARNGFKMRRAAYQEASLNQRAVVKSEDPGWNRIEWFEKFSQQLAQGDFFFKEKTFPHELHNVQRNEQEALAMESFLLGTSGMLPQERATYDAAIIQLQKNKAEGKSDLVETGIQQLQQAVTGRSKEKVRAALLSEGWHINDAALDQCLKAAETFVNQETDSFRKPITR